MNHDPAHHNHRYPFCCRLYDGDIAVGDVGMSREIKFRGWHFKKEQMFSAETMAADDMTITATGHFINVSGADTKLSHIFPHDVFLPLQFTGLKDESGKEIYEGDVLKYTRSVSHPEFEFVQKSIGVAAIRPSKGVVLNKAVIYYDYESSEDGGEIERDVPRKAPHAIEVSGCHAEIVGNIYENPELVQ